MERISDSGYLSLDMMPPCIDSITVEDGNPSFYAKNNCLIREEDGELVLGCRNSVIPDDGSVRSIGAFAFNGLYIEMKFEKGRTTKAQEEFMALLREQGYKTAVAYGAEQAREVIRHYLARGEGFDLVNCEHAFKMCGYCEGVAVDWAPCEKCQFFKANKERGKK
mgnify:FL=1